MPADCFYGFLNLFQILLGIRSWQEWSTAADKKLIRSHVRLHSDPFSRVGKNRSHLRPQIHAPVRSLETGIT
jgi:hypothetical protein